MAQSDSPVSIALAICIMIALGVIAVFHFSVEPLQPVSEESFSFETLEIDEARLKSERKKLLEGVDLTLATQEIKALHGAIKAANAAQFSINSAKQTNQAEARVEVASNDVLTKIPQTDAFVETGSKLFHACQNELAIVLDDIKSKKVTFEMMKTAPPAEYGSYAEACGNVLPMLEGRGLVTAAGEWADKTTGPAILELLSRYRYAFIIGVRRPAMTQLTPYEKQILLRWRIEDPTAYPVKERLSFLRKATQADLGYDPRIAHGKLLFMSGDKVDARLKYEEACAADPKNHQLQMYCKWLVKHVPLAPGAADNATH